jgi:hypothetical protein
MMRVGASVAVLVLLCAGHADAFSTASVRFFGTGGGTAVDRIKVPVDPPAPADVGAGDFTIEFWMKGTLAGNVTPSDGYRASGDTEESNVDWIFGNIIVDRDIFGPGPDWGMSIHRDGSLRDRGVLRFGTENGPPDSTQDTLQGRVHVLDGSWHHVAFVRERASGRKRIYVDGVLDVVSAASVSTGNLSYPDGRPTSYPDSDPFLVFGAEKHGYPGTSSFPSFAGWIDEIRVWSVARSAAEIDAAKAQSVAPSSPGLVLYLRLEEGSGTTLTDATGGNTATLYSGVPGNGEWSTDTPAGAGTTTSTTATTVTTTTRPPGAQVDHFKCYKARTAAAVKRRSVLLIDAFGSKNTIVLKPDSFCNPVDKNGEGITDATAHLTCYRIRDANGQARFAQQSLSLQNQFGSGSLLAVIPRVLCVPSEAGGVPSALNVDHFKCYRTAALTSFARRNVFLADQFENKNTTVLRPCSVCLPVDKNGEGIQDPLTSLTCYRIRDVSGQPRFSPAGVTVHNQFGDTSLTALRARSLCVPSTGAPVAETFAARLRWLPSADPGVAGYRVYPRLLNAPYVSAQDAGLPVPASDGTLSSVVTCLDRAMDHAFAVTAYLRDGEESPFSNELGLPSPRRLDVGPGESGQCTVAGKCDTAGDLALPPGGRDLRVTKFLLKHVGRRRLIVAKGSFATAAVLNPIRTGATIEVRAGDGEALYKATLQGWAFRSDRGHRTFRYAVPHGRAPPGARGIKAFRVKLKPGGADVRTRILALNWAALARSSGQIHIIWVIRLGAECVRDLHLVCRVTRSRTGNCARR